MGGCVRAIAFYMSDSLRQPIAVHVSYAQGNRTYANLTLAAARELHASLGAAIARADQLAKDNLRLVPGGKV
jgi:hypothetical protein